MNFYIGLDVGGTNIKSGVILESGELLADEIHMVPSLAKENQETLLNHFFDIIVNELNRAPTHSMLLGVGVGFPGPFDYPNGISKIQGINKYDSLYDINIGEALSKKLHSVSSIASRLAPSFAIRFENDATLYALGELVKGNASSEGKCLCVCIGTGLGSAFLEDGKLITDREDVPHCGWVYATPFKTSIIDDHLSARGIMNHYNTHAASLVTSVKPIADACLAENLIAQNTFTYFGTSLGEGLNIFLNQFPATTLVIGGQISKSYPLFEQALLASLNSSPTIKISPDTSRSALIGTTKLF